MCSAICVYLFLTKNETCQNCSLAYSYEPMDKRCANDGDIVMLWHICFEKNYFFHLFL